MTWWENTKDFFRNLGRGAVDVWHWFTPILNTVGKLLVRELGAQGLAIVKALVSKYEIMDLVGTQKRKRVFAEARKMLKGVGIDVVDSMIYTAIEIFVAKLNEDGEL